MRADLEAIAQHFAGRYSVDEKSINGYRAVALTFVTSRAAYLRAEHLFLEYFDGPIKREGEAVRVPEIVPAQLVPFVNAPLGHLLGTLAIKKGYSSEAILTTLVDTEGGSQHPLLDLTMSQTLYAKTQTRAGAIKTVELAKICPHASNPTQATVVLTGFYALLN